MNLYAQKIRKNNNEKKAIHCGIDKKQRENGINVEKRILLSEEKKKLSK